MSEVISRADAKAAGLNYYFTGKSCKNDHVAPRYASTGICKECQRTRNKANGNLPNEYRRKRCVADPEGEREKVRQRYALDPQKGRARSRAWYERNSEKAAAASRVWRATVAGRARMLLLAAEYRSERLGAPCDITYDFVLALLSDALALGIVTCEAHKPDTASIDQVIAGKGYTKGNIQIVPWWYNAAKHEFSAKELHEAMSRWRLVYG